jgi:hypothetical protein
VSGTGREHRLKWRREKHQRMGFSGPVELHDKLLLLLFLLGLLAGATTLHNSQGALPLKVLVIASVTVALWE